jgi:hypothetical protein
MSFEDPTVHVAGLALGVQHTQRIRQLCAWCGHVLVDVDVSAIGMVVEPDGTGDVGDGQVPATWELGSLVEVYGSMQVCLAPAEEAVGSVLPERSCTRRPLISA